MKLSKKLLYSAVVLATVAGPTVSTVAQFATGMSVVRAEDVRQVVTDIPTKTTVNVFKLVSEAYKEDVIKAGGIENKDGAIISKEDLQSKLAAAGAEVKALNNVTFSAYLIKDQKLTDEDAKKVTTKEDADKLVEEGKLELAEEQTTAGDGKATFQLNSQVSENGKKVYARYLFIESAAPRTVSSAIAVPFVMTLPASPESGNGYYSDVNVYPKNIQGNEPKAGKDVKTLGNNILPAQVGENITFFLKGTIPTNIQDYSQYDFTDELDSQLSLTSKTTDFKVSFGENNVLEYTTDYTVDIQNNKVKVALTRAGIDKVAKNTTIAQRRASEALGDKIHDEKNNTADAPFIQVSFNAKLNDTVKLGKAVNNETTITYSNRSDKNTGVKPNTPTTPDKPNTPDKPKETKSDKTVVVSAGARFTKVDASTTETKLPGATFKIYVDQATKNPLTWTEDLIKLNKANSDNQSKFNGTVQPGEPIVMKSDNDGKFEFAGLPLGTVHEKTENGVKTTTATYADGVEGIVDAGIDAKLSQLQVTYYLKEETAPAGYVKNNNAIPFTMSTKTYDESETPVELGVTTAGQKLVKNNKRPSIPNTGGIGTAIFVAIGAAVMAFAAKGMKRRTKDN
ncbi:fimbrial protein [Streptococcus dysgalactiae subsp. equisimilis]|uniref:SpaH/EbpB family LPXTG-anchored major pilin n=1 Tax=Streptococcus dysgalactiae TaxID=1334 RepID=UPI000806FD66|nr:SpaH/EbpB family LPXTG-anchored major pilin [Streptococcus dysgalactiae]OBY99595.1 fimbrial protein [Streptococcus dysgalactiae subsp. equisimilis]